MLELQDAEKEVKWLRSFVRSNQKVSEENQKELLRRLDLKQGCTITVDHRKPLEFQVIPLKFDGEIERGGSGNVLFHTRKDTRFKF